MGTCGHQGRRTVERALGWARLGTRWDKGRAGHERARSDAACDQGGLRALSGALQSPAGGAVHGAPPSPTPRGERNSSQEGSGRPWEPRCRGGRKEKWG